MILYLELQNHNMTNINEWYFCRRANSLGYWYIMYKEKNAYP